MEVFNQDWKHQWDAFMSAPYIIAPFVIGGGFIGWWLKGIKSDNIMNGLNGRIEIFGERLTLAAEKVEAANQAKAEIERQFQVYKSDVAANKEHSALAATAAKVDAAIDRLTAANNAVRSAVVIDNISNAVKRVNDSLSDTPLPLRDQAEAAKDGNGE